MSPGPALSPSRHMVFANGTLQPPGADILPGTTEIPPGATVVFSTSMRSVAADALGGSTVGEKLMSAFPSANVSIDFRAFVSTTYCSIALPVATLWVA